MGAVLAVHRQQRVTRFFRRLRHQFAARDERLLVGQQHAFAAGKRFHHRRQADHAHDRDKHIVRVARVHHIQQHVFAEHPLAAVFDIRRNFLRLDGKRRNLRMELAHLFKELFA